MRWWSLDQTLCRDHGRAIALDWLRQTLIKGWWGAFAIMANIVAILVNLYALGRASTLPLPEMRRSNAA